MYTFLLLYPQELKEKLKDIAENYKNLYITYEEKKTIFLEEKKARETTNGISERTGNCIILSLKIHKS